MVDNQLGSIVYKNPQLRIVVQYAASNCHTNSLFPVEGSQMQRAGRLRLSLLLLLLGSTGFFVGVSLSWQLIRQQQELIVVDSQLGPDEALLIAANETNCFRIHGSQCDDRLARMFLVRKHRQQIALISLVGGSVVIGGAVLVFHVLRSLPSQLTTNKDSMP